MKTKPKQFCRKAFAVLCAAVMMLGTLGSDISMVTARAETGSTELANTGGSDADVVTDEVTDSRYDYDMQGGNKEGEALTSDSVSYDRITDSYADANETVQTEGTEARKIDVWDFGAKLETNTFFYTNQITPQTWLDKNLISNGDGSDKYGDGTVIKKGVFKGEAKTEVPFGDVTIIYDKGDRLYSGASQLAGINYGAIQSFAAEKYSDGYQAAGGWYTNGTGGDARRLVTIANVQAGDKIVAYTGTHAGSNNNPDTTFFFEYMGTDGTQKDSVDMDATKFQKCEFIAEYSGTYRIWENNRCKPMYHRIMRVPGVKVSGTIDYDTYKGTGHSLKFLNQTTKKETTAELDGANFTVTLAPGYTYTAVFSGTVEYGISNDTKSLTVTDEDSVTGKNNVALRLVSKAIYTYSGKITGFAEGYDTSKLAVTLTPPKGADLDEVNLAIDENLNFTVNLEQGNEYTLGISGVNDYEIKSSAKVKLTANLEEDIVVGLKPMYDVTGGFIGLDSGKVTELTLTNIEDDYVYPATVTDNGYSIKLRNGSYLASAVAEGYSTKTHVIVNGGAVSRDLMFGSTEEKGILPWAAHVYVGYPDKKNNYDTVAEAVEVCKRMNPRDERHRIKVHIAPGTYREQVIVTTPYISFVNDTDKQVLLTWYYGIGYKYYSADETGFYNPENDYDKFYKNGNTGKDVSTWGVTLLIEESATGFRAEGITFENSFNRYLTKEELEDGVENAGTQGEKPARKAGTDVQTKAATERATAVGIRADQVEFKNCGFFSSQDTLFTGGEVPHNMYFKNCLIEGQTDYIFGDGNAIFDECELRWKGYSAGSTGGYITAGRRDAGAEGYLFRNCTVTANSALTVTGGYWGRPWRQTAGVVFLNTKLEKANLITAVGWNSMSGNTADKAYFYEYNTTTMDGKAVDTSKRSKHVMTAEKAAAINNSTYFGNWVPYYYLDAPEKEELLDFAIEPVGDKAYGDEAFALSVTGEGDATGAVTYESSDESIIRIEGDKAVVVKAGTAIITAIKAEDEVYREGVADLIVTVERKSLTVKAESKLNVIKGSAMPELTFRADGLINGDVYSSPVFETEVENTDTAGTYEITVSGGTLTSADGADMTDSYEVTYVNGKITIVDEPGRVAGTSRYETSLKSADMFKELKGVDQFEAVVIAAGGAFPDALAGSTLAAAKNAPILLAGKDLNTETKATLDYVAKNVKPGGEIYILGGSAAVSEEAEQQLKADGYRVTRIAGTNRYETNLKLLENLEVVEGTDVIIASGSNYPDSIAVSGVAGAKGMPIILTGEKMTDEAIAKIKEIKPEHIYLIGGTSAVSETVEGQVQGLGQVKRVAGTNRYATSLEIAKAFGLQNADAVVIAYGNNFPDGLTGSVIAAEANAPIILVSDSNYKEQAEFIKNSNIKSFYILGGTGVISDDTVRELLGL